MKEFKSLVLFVIGGLVYITIEIVWRKLMGSHPTHWTMFVLGGLSFVVVGGINEFFPWEMPFWLQTAIGTVCVLILEFTFGCLINIQAGLNVWDYSHLPLNILGQVCLPFTFAWAALVAFAIVLDDYLRYWLFGEEKPRYTWRFKKQ